MERLKERKIAIIAETVVIMIAANRKIAAIKLVRSLYDCDLIEAMAVVESIKAVGDIDQARRFSQR